MSYHASRYQSSASPFPCHLFLKFTILLNQFELKKGTRKWQSITSIFHMFILCWAMEIGAVRFLRGLLYITHLFFIFKYIKIRKISYK